VAGAARGGTGINAPPLISVNARRVEQRSGFGRLVGLYRVDLPSDLAIKHGARISRPDAAARDAIRGSGSLIARGEQEEAQPRRDAGLEQDVTRRDDPV